MFYRLLEPSPIREGLERVASPISEASVGTIIPIVPTLHMICSDDDAYGAVHKVCSTWKVKPNYSRD